MQNIIYKDGTAQVTVPATESIAVATEGQAFVYSLVGYPNQPVSKTLLAVVNNGETVFGAYASGATIVIEAKAARVVYAVGVAPVVGSIRGWKNQGTPGVLDATGALTSAMIQSGIVTSTTAAAVAGTLPTGAVLDAAADIAIGESFDWSVITTGANAFTVTAAASGHTVVGNMVVAAGKAGLFRTRKTAADTFVTYSLANT